MEYARDLGTDEVLIVGLEDIDILLPSTLDRLERVIDRISGLSVDTSLVEEQAAGTQEAGNERQKPETPNDLDMEFDDFEEGFAEPDMAMDAADVGIVRRIRSVLSARRVRRQGDALITDRMRI